MWYLPYLIDMDMYMYIICTERVNVIFMCVCVCVCAFSSASALVVDNKCNVMCCTCSSFILGCNNFHSKTNESRTWNGISLDVGGDNLILLHICRIKFYQTKAFFLAWQPLGTE